MTTHPYAGRTSVLALGTFAVGTSGYVVAGLLPALTAELHVSAATAAQLVTAFAIAYAIGSPLFAAATGRWERRTLLVVALLVTALGNVLAALAPGYGLLFAARMVTAIGAAVFTPAASMVAAELNPPHRRGRAVAAVFGGLTLATILGVPLGSLLSGPLGYRWVFALVAVFSVLGALAVRLALPAVAPPPPVPLAQRFTVARDPRALAVLVTTVLGCLAAFSVYTFVTPVLAATAGVTGTTVSLLLLCYGIGGALGNYAGGRAADRWGSRRPLIVVIASLTVVLLTLPLIATSVPGAAIALLLWGLTTWSFNPPVQHRLIELGGSNAGLLLSLNASAIYLGVGLSGVVGGIVLTNAGPTALPPVAAALTAVGGLVVLLFGWRSPARAQSAPADTGPGAAGASAVSRGVPRPHSPVRDRPAVRARR
ncbi:MFS transporter [Amycolatopsis palatopharyngis]|uniref:MFS transporter n=1 Tax=Amycolatopsis palatopharyngis TaxID=187982 RepID=UPI000E289BF2|nr:MFS transporter [Amycolatopsis palatopharyngis]